MKQPTALMTVRGSDRPPTFESAADQLGVEVDDIDREYGFVPINPAEHLYAVQVRADRVPFHGDSPYRGPYAQPRIEPFGHARTDQKRSTKK